MVSSSWFYMHSRARGIRETDSYGRFCHPLYMVKMGFKGVNIIFPIFTQNKGSEFSLELSQWGGSNASLRQVRLGSGDITTFYRVSLIARSYLAWLVIATGWRRILLCNGQNFLIVLLPSRNGCFWIKEFEQNIWAYTFKSWSSCN